MWLVNGLEPPLRGYRLGERLSGRIAHATVLVQPEVFELPGAGGEGGSAGVRRK